MRAIPQRVIRGILLVALTFSVTVPPVVADNTINQQVKDAHDDLTEATQDVLDAQQSLADARKKLPAARTRLEQASQEEAVARQKYNVAAAALADAKAQLKDAQDAVAAIQKKIIELQSKVDEFARSVYQQGQASQWEIILQAESPSDLSSRLQAIKAVSAATSRSLDDLNDAKAELKVQVDKAQAITDKMQGLADDAAQTLSEAQAATDRAEIAKGAVDSLIAQESRALSVAEAFKQKTKRRYDILRKEQIRLSGIGTSSGNGDGTLEWPLPGYAAGGGVGPRTNPYTGQKGCHTGQDIGAPSGTPIRAAATGEVIYVGWSTAYGKVTMIDHGDGLVTMYAHQSSFKVGKGQVVASGDVIGYVGSTGFSTGPHLHFEVHVNGKNYNPMGWFGGSKYVVACAPTRGI